MSEIPQARIVSGTVDAPPRTVPLPLALRLCIGSPAAQAGWIVVCAGLVFALLTAHVAHAFDARADGEIVRVIQDPNTGPKHPRFRVQARFRDADGLDHVVWIDLARPVAPGPCELVYERANPSHVTVRADVARRALAVGLFLGLLGVGAAMTALQIRAGRRASYLLRYGVPTEGRLVDLVQHPKRGTLLTFEYDVGGERRQTTTAAAPGRTLARGDAAPIVFDPADPTLAVPLDGLPGAPQLAADGQVVFRPGRVVHLLVLPAACAVLAVATALALV